MRVSCKYMNLMYNEYIMYISLSSGQKYVSNSIDFYIPPAH